MFRLYILNFRDDKEKKEAKERWWKVYVFSLLVRVHTDVRLSIQLHEQGKTDQAKADLSRLTKIRAEREAAAAKRKAETEGEFSASLSCTGIYRSFQRKPRKSKANERKLSRRARDSEVLHRASSAVHAKSVQQLLFTVFQTLHLRLCVGRVVTCTDTISRGLCTER